MPDAVAVGVRPEAIKAIRDKRDEDLTPEERQLAVFIREFARGTVTEESFTGIVERYGPRGAVEFAGFVGWLLMTERLVCALAPPPTTDVEVDERIQGFLAGTEYVPPPKSHIG